MIRSLICQSHTPLPVDRSSSLRYQTVEAAFCRLGITGKPQDAASKKSPDQPRGPGVAGGNQSARPDRARAAFTLIEVLVAATVSILLISLLLSAVQGISNNYLRTQGSITRQGNSAFALDQLVQDLESLVVPHFAGAEALRLTPETAAAATNAAWLTLLATTTDDDTAASPNNMFNGATRAVSYRLSHQNSIEGSATNPSYALYRMVASSLDTFTNAISQADAQAGFWASLQPTKIDCLLSENVVAFSIRFLKADGTWTPPGSKIRIGRDGTTVDGIPVDGGFKRAEITITVLSPEGARRVADGIMPLSQAISRYGRTSVRQTSHF